LKLQTQLSPGHPSGWGFSLTERQTVVRRRDWLIDKKIGSVIRMRRVKLGLTQADLGNALGVSFQQILAKSPRVRFW
jgi:hypothetical protein